MKVLQMQATSAAIPGESGRSFRVVAASPEIDHATVRGLLQLFGRMAPQGIRSAGASPRQSPFLLHQVLPNGRVLLARFVEACTDTGPERDTLPTWFVHCLVTPDASGVFPLPPIQLFDWPGWNQQPGRGDLLPTMTSLSCGPGMELESLEEHIRQPENLDRLPSVLTALQRSLLRGRRMVFVAPPEVVAAWMGVVSYLLPTQFTGQMTFITSASAPARAGVMVAGTTAGDLGRPGTDELPEDTVLLDFETSPWKGPASHTPFARLVARAFQDGRTEPLTGFPDFAQRLFPQMSITDLDAAFIYYGLASGLFPDDRDLPPMLEYLADRFSALATRGAADAVPHLVVEQTAAEALQFREPNVFRLLKNRATDEHNLDLLCLLNGILAFAQPHERAELFREALRAARQWFGAAGDLHVTTAYDWIWASTSPTAHDGIALLEQLEQPTPQIVTSLVTLLEKDAQMGRMLPEHALLLEALKHLDTDRLGDHAALVQAFDVGEELAQGKCEGRILWQAIECSRKIPAHLATALMEKAASVVVDIEEPTSQRRNVHQWTRLGGNTFLEPYRRMATLRLAGSRGNVGIAVRLFSSWIHEPADFDNEPWRTLLNECFTEGLANWERTEIAKVDTRLESHSELGPLWVRWYRDHDHGGGGVLWRLKQRFAKK